MKNSLIDNTILILCKEISLMPKENVSWKNMSEEDLLFEIAICIFSSQDIFEKAIAMAQKLKDNHIFSNINYNEIEYKIKIILSNTLNYKKNNIIYYFKPRFKNRNSKLLTNTIKNIYGNKITIKTILSTSTNEKDARNKLINYICGFGPKQSSLYLRRIGFCDNLAILDSHIIDYLYLNYGFSINKNSLSKLDYYEKIEEKFHNLAKDLGYSIACVDLATWITMRVAKREAMLWA